MHHIVSKIECHLQAGVKDIRFQAMGKRWIDRTSIARTSRQYVITCIKINKQAAVAELIVSYCIYRFNQLRAQEE